MRSLLNCLLPTPKALAHDVNYQPSAFSRYMSEKNSINFFACNHIVYARSLIFNALITLPGYQHICGETMLLLAKMNYRPYLIKLKKSFFSPFSL